jgi:23S rRNA (adenine1618-N6)-methyltransferase
MKTGDICGLDIGVGASCVYPIIGTAEYGWKFVGIDVDPIAQMSSQAIIDNNARLQDKVELRLQENPFCIFHGALRDNDKFAFCMTNPPFHANMKDANAATTRKWRNLGKASPFQQPVLNFGGVESELCCAGGEVGFLARMIEESIEPFVRDRIGLFTALVSSQDSLPVLLRLLHELPTRPKVHTVEMKHGQKKSRILAWRHQK